MILTHGANSLARGGCEIKQVIYNNKICVVDPNGFIGIVVDPKYPWTEGARRGAGNIAIVVDGDYSSAGLGSVVFVNFGSVVIGGRTYKTIIMPDGKEWLAENLDYKYPGLEISTVLSETIPRARYYGNDESTHGVTGDKWGLLYNWAAVDYLEQNKATLLPQGWHAPSTDEINALNTAAGTGYYKKLLSWEGFDSSNGLDFYGFNAPPSGDFWTNGFYGGGQVFYLWASDTNTRFEYNLSSSNKKTENKSFGFSVRLVKDSE